MRNCKPKKEALRKPTAPKGTFIPSARTPLGAQYEFEGIYYKQGLHGYIYRWNGENWMKTQLKKYDVKNFKVAV